MPHGCLVCERRFQGAVLCGPRRWGCFAPPGRLLWRGAQALERRVEARDLLAELRNVRADGFETLPELAADHDLGERAIGDEWQQLWNAAGQRANALPMQEPGQERLGRTLPFTWSGFPLLGTPPLRTLADGFPGRVRSQSAQPPTPRPVRREVVRKYALENGARRDECGAAWCRSAASRC